MKNRDKPSPSQDLYSRLNYRKMIAWPRRLQREAPFLNEVLSRAPGKSILDLGCGTGEHSRYLAAQGFKVVGIDASSTVIDEASQETINENPQFLCGDLRALNETLGERRFDVALCLGNTLVHLITDEDLKRAVRGLAEVLRPGGLFLAQILNYQRIFEKGIRYLPLNFTSQPDHELVFLRLMELGEEGKVLFCPTTLRLNPSLDQPVEVVHSRRVELRGWRLKQIETFLQQDGFTIRSIYGDMERGAFHPSDSSDLVILAERND